MKYAYVRVFLDSTNMRPSFGHTFVEAKSEDQAYTFGGRVSDEALGCPDGYGGANDYVFLVKNTAKKG